ncbi:MAG: 2-oxoglutarate dehydrogenase E1 component [Gemmataceae bacterium]
MTPASIAGPLNLELIEATYQRWRHDPASVDPSWRWFFEGFDLGLAQQPAAAPAAGPTADAKQFSVIRLIDAYRRLGHLLARLDPLSDPPQSVPLLELKAFGLSEEDLDRTFDTSYFLGDMPHARLRDLITELRATYCRTIGVEFMHIADRTIRSWLMDRIELSRNRPDYTRRRKLRILMNLHYAELFEKFLHTRYLGQKRFSLEGAETLIPLLDTVVEASADNGIKEIVLGMAHRGRLNVLANIIGKPYTEIFTEFEENFLPNSMAGDGDVKYHLGFSSDRVSSKGNKIHLSLTPNPSHLEAVNPVVEGRVRAKQHHFGDRRHMQCLALLLHGDAAVAGQGLVAETLNLSQLSGYKTGGTIHVVINNQIGFTTSPRDARSTRYCTDVAKMIEAPIFHVNAEDPEACLFVAELAVDFRQTFNQDFFIDMYCYRKHGHNEGDEPSFTQPIMYAEIQKKPTMTKIYHDRLLERGDLSEDEIATFVQEFQVRLQKAQEEVKGTPGAHGMRGYQGQWKALVRDYSWGPTATAVPERTLRQLVEAMSRLPEDFTPHPKVARLLEDRRSMVDDGAAIDWGMAELLSFGSLLLDGIDVRLSGQDSRRGTFSHRHSVLYDYKTGKPYSPLQHLQDKQGDFNVFDSLLSESAVLGFEFGYSLDSPNCLTLWEAQFGDFGNGAQVIVDQFISCSSSKWNRDSGLVLLLPHGYEGQGPEHSSARLERYLQLCAEDNFQVVNATTPAQYFHLLRRQLLRNFRKPLVVMTPKSLLRHKLVVSSLDDFTQGRFDEILEDRAVDAQKVRRVVLCSGKVYYDLLEQRKEEPVVLVRVEQLYPFPSEAIQKAVRSYPKAKEYVWAQEESLNMGAWSFVEPRLRAMGFRLKYVGRDASASPATGSRQVHLREQKELVEAAIRGQAPHLVRSFATASQRRQAEYEQEGLAIEPPPTLEIESRVSGT